MAMNNNEVLNELYCEQRKMNRHLEKLNVVALMGVLLYLGKNAKDEESKRMCKVGMGFAMVAHVLITIRDILNINITWRRNNERE